MSRFEDDVRSGLSGPRKQISSKYFYDETGDDLFVQIMNLPEYYLSRCEHEILKNCSPVIANELAKTQPFDLLELGAGDGTKTMELLKVLQDRNIDFTYKPLDISPFAVENLEIRLKEELPGLKTMGIVGDYFQVLSQLDSSVPKTILFLGSNIGNMTDDIAQGFLNKIANFMNSGDQLLVGFDLIKSKDIVLPAYNDAQGVTKRFNLNLLERMNRELGANFDLEHWEHAPDYSEETGITSSALKSLKEQTVHFSNMNWDVDFKEGEFIHTEISRKYNLEIIHKITQNCQFKILEDLRDSRGYFADILFQKI